MCCIFNLFFNKLIDCAPWKCVFKHIFRCQNHVVHLKKDFQMVSQDNGNQHISVLCWRGKSIKSNCTSFPSEGKLNGIATHTTEGIDNELCTEAVLRPQSNVLCYLLRSHWEPALCGKNRVTCYAHHNSNEKAFISSCVLSFSFCLLNNILRWQKYYSNDS